MKRVLNAVGYNRVSTPGQVDNTSLSYQSKVIKNRANADGVNLIKIFSEEGKSGTNTNRPEYRATKKYLVDNDVDILYVYDTSRLHRNLLEMTLDLKWFRDHNKKIIFVSQDWDSSCEADYDMIIAQAIVDEKYSRSIKNNSLRGLNSRAADCMHTGGKPPYGFKVNRDTMLLEPDETTAPAVKKMFELYADGFGTADIIKWLSDNGYKTSNGNDFKVSTINEILHNEKYKGCYTWNKAASKDEDGKRNTHKHKESYFKKEGGCPALVTPTIFEKVQQKLNENAEKHRNRAPDRYYPLTGMIYCSCGSPMCGSVKYSKGRRYYKYICNHKCGAAPIRADYLEAFVINAVSNCLFSEPNRQPLLDSLNNISRNKKNISNKEYRALRRALTGLEERHRNLMKALEKGKVTDSIMNSLEKIERQKGEIHTKIKLLSRGSRQFSEADLQRLQEGFGKKAKPAHKVKLYFPSDTTAVIGHTRFTTQGSEKNNYNNHPFEGSTDTHTFALAHNGVLYNDKELRKEKELPETKIETDSYIAVQLIEHENSVDSNSIKTMAEAVTGSFVFTILRDDNTLFLVKGDNPITLIHFPEYGLYVYASTTAILTAALKAVKLAGRCEKVPVNDGNIIRIDSDGKLSVSTFEEQMQQFDWRYLYRLYGYDYDDKDEDYANDLLMICGCYGVDREDVELLLELGYTTDEIEEMLMDSDLFEQIMNEVKTLYQR